jgi:hypothetical protein
MIHLFISLFMLVDGFDLTIVNRDQIIPEKYIETNFDSAYVFSRKGFFAKKKFEQVIYYDESGKRTKSFLVQNNERLSYMEYRYNENVIVKYDNTIQKQIKELVFDEDDRILLKIEYDRENNKYDTTFYEWDRESLIVTQEKKCSTFSFRKNQPEYHFLRVEDKAIRYSYVKDKNDLIVLKQQKEVENIFFDLEFEKYFYNRKKQLVKIDFYYFLESDLKFKKDFVVRYWYFSNPYGYYSKITKAKNFLYVNVYIGNKNYYLFKCKEKGINERYIETTKYFKKNAG